MISKQDVDKIKEHLNKKTNMSANNYMASLQFIDSMTEAEKSCATCQYHTYHPTASPCTGCLDKSNWEPKEVEEPEKSCKTCYHNLHGMVAACHVAKCKDHSFWTPILIDNTKKMELLSKLQGFGSLIENRDKINEIVEWIRAQ